MSLRLSVFTVVLASACTINGTPMGSRGALTAPQATSPPPSGESHDDTRVFHTDAGVNFDGLTVADARAAAATAGWTGDIEVHEATYDPDCKAGAVCRFWPTDWNLKIGGPGVLEFFVNPTVTISAPPPP